MIPRQITVVSLAIATSLLGDSALYTILPTHAEQLGIRLALVGVLLSANRFVRLLSNSWSGKIHDQFHSSWPFMMALIVGACITAIYGLFWGFWIFFAARLAWGVCWSFLRLEGYSSVITESPPDSRGKLMGAYKSIITIGFMAGGTLGGLLTDTMGYRKCMLYFACFSLIGAFALFLEKLRNNKPQKSIAERDITKRSVEENADTKPQDINLPARWIVYLMGFANILVSSSVVGSTLGRLLKIRFGMNIPLWRTSIGVASVTGILSLIRRMIAMFLAPVMGHFADRAGRNFILIFGLAINIVALVLMATQKSFLLIALSSSACSVSYISISISLDASIVDMASKNKPGQQVSRYVTFTDLGSACGPLVSYFLLSIRIGIGWVYMGGLALLIAVCVLYGLSVTTSCQT
ncbi:MFS transporter [Candidatus Poribacteria bacterium]|nr:MFS transporter [Candidatus Poribacteria bacterium]